MAPESVGAFVAAIAEDRGEDPYWVRVIVLVGRAVAVTVVVPRAAVLEIEAG